MKAEEGYFRQYEIRWADLDPNSHMRGSAYADYAVEVRMRYLMEQGFSPQRFAELGFGPVILREENRYLREIQIGETIRINFLGAGMSPDAASWMVQHEFYKSNGKLAAVLKLEGGWLDLHQRRLIAPPEELARLMQNLARTGDFKELPPLHSRHRAEG